MSRLLPLIAMIALGLVVGSGISDAVAQAEIDETTEATEAEQLSATQRALAELTAAYQGLSGMLGQGSNEAVDRVQDDIENLGDWEYRIVDFSDASPEAIEAELNLLGNERWEAYWIQPLDDEVRVYLKRPSISYISRVPLSTLVRMLAGGAQ